MGERTALPELVAIRGRSDVVASALVRLLAMRQPEERTVALFMSLPTPVRGGCC